MALCRPRHGHSTDNSPHSFLGRILAPTLWFALSMDLFLGPQCVSTCFCLRLLKSLCLLVHDYNIVRAWRCAALGTDILQITHLIPFVFEYFVSSLYSMKLFIGPQSVSTCYSRWLMSRRLLVHDFNKGRAWHCAALGTDILRITHLIPFVSLYSCTIFLFCIIHGSIPWSAGRKYLLLPSLHDVSSSSGS